MSTATSEKPLSTPVEDPFDSLLTLEDTLYTSAYDLGVQDGARAGRIEGRVFGLEKGFEKFAALGSLHGRACIWEARAQKSRKDGAVQGAEASNEDLSKSEEKQKAKTAEPHSESMEGSLEKQIVLPLLPSNARLQKHISLFHGLTDPLTFSSENTEDAVADFDDRFKRAGAKAKMIERMIGEYSGLEPATNPGQKRRGMKVSGEGKKEESMEDFAGSRFLG